MTVPYSKMYDDEEEKEDIMEKEKYAEVGGVSHAESFFMGVLASLLFAMVLYMLFASTFNCNYSCGDQFEPCPNGVLKAACRKQYDQGQGPGDSGFIFNHTCMFKVIQGGMVLKTGPC